MSNNIMRFPSSLLLYRLILALTLIPIAAAQQHAVELKDYYQLETIPETALSPDGRLVAFVRTRIVEGQNKRHSEIWLSPADGSTTPVRVSNPTVSANGPRWSPDSKLLAYSAGGQWFVHLDGQSKAPFQIAGVGGAPVFSPDNRSIAFTKKVAPPKAPAPQLSEFDRLTQERFKGRIYDWMTFRFDVRGYLPDPRDPQATPPLELFTVPIEGGEPRQITHLGVDVLTPAWRKDG
jgi:Tol biopolymer transport system component